MGDAESVVKIAGRRIWKKLKRFRWYQYVVAALALHLVLVFVSPYIRFRGPMTDRVLFKSAIKKVKQKLTAQQKIEKRRVEKVPIEIRPRTVSPDAARYAEQKYQAKVAQATPANLKATFTLLRAKTQRVLQRTKVTTEGVVSQRKGEMTKAAWDYKAKHGVKYTGARTEAQFDPFVATYQGGDANFNPKSMPNLMLEITRRSNIRIDLGKPIKKIGLDDPKLTDVPFVYMTGKTDFRFTDTEVTNLRNFLMRGGGVYADNGLPGRRSAFDIAFRREMKRVLPDQEFEPVAPEHKIFHSFYDLSDLPSGLNWRGDPIDIMEIGDRVVVIYAVNGYGNYWETRLTEKNDIDQTVDENWSHVWGPYWEPSSRWQFENLDAKTIEQAYRLGINVIVFFLTR